MKIDQKLRSFVNTLPSACHKMSIQYGLSVAAKTRTFSHVSFVRKSLSLKVIPHGFKKSSNLNFSSPRTQSSSDRAFMIYSRRLMRITLNNFTYRSAARKVEDCRVYFASNTDLTPRLIKGLKSCVYTLNQSLYVSLRDTKERKLLKLLPQHHIKSNDKLAVSFPEDHLLSQSECHVLAKGLKFVPTPSCIDEDEILHDLEAFYPRVRLHAHINDPNKRIREGPPEDPFDKYQ